MKIVSFSGWIADKAFSARDYPETFLDRRSSGSGMSVHVIDVPIVEG